MLVDAMQRVCILLPGEVVRRREKRDPGSFGRALDGWMAMVHHRRSLVCSSLYRLGDRRLGEYVYVREEGVAYP